MVEDLNFQYGDLDSQQILKQFNLEIPSKQITVIVGVSGSGKTSFMKILAGLYTEYDGNIYIGNSDLKDLNAMDWSKQASLLYEENYMFSQSISENIRLAKEMSKDALERACRLAGIDQFIKDLPLKYDTIIGEDGIRISKGQEQQILLARLIYQDPELFLLDEAISAIDAVTARRIMMNLKDSFPNKTIVMVSHRHHVLKEADKIVVVHKGRVLEEGKHEDLLFKKGAYYLFVKNEIQA